MSVGTGSAPGARRVARPPAPRPGDLGDHGIDPDQLPDGPVGADEQGTVICFNHAAGRTAALPAEPPLSPRSERVLPQPGLGGRPWGQRTDPYGGLAIRNGQPERNLLLPGGREVLVAARYVRTRPTGPLRRLVVTRRDTEARRRTERSHAEL